MIFHRLLRGVVCGVPGFSLGLRRCALLSPPYLCVPLHCAALGFVGLRLSPRPWPDSWVDICHQEFKPESSYLAMHE